MTCRFGRIYAGLQLAGIIVFVSFGGAAAPARAEPGDVVSTDAYLHAEYARLRATLPAIAQAGVRIDTYASRLRGECPDVIGGEPQPDGGEPTSLEAKVSDEIYDVSVGVAERWERPANEHFARLVGKLR